MRLFAPDLYRNFTLGFALGAAVIGAATIDHWAGQLESPANAAETMPSQQLSADSFFIAQPEVAE